MRPESVTTTTNCRQQTTSSTSTRLGPLPSPHIEPIITPRHRNLGRITPDEPHKKKKIETKARHHLRAKYHPPLNGGAPYDV